MDRHAGYSYSGPTAAWAYRSIDPTDVYAFAMVQVDADGRECNDGYLIVECMCDDGDGR